MTDRHNNEDDFIEVRIRLPKRVCRNYKLASRNVGLATSQLMRTVLVDYDNRARAKAERSEL